MSTAPAWLVASLAADPQRFGLLPAACILPEAWLGGPRSLAAPSAEVASADGGAIRCAVLGLAGPQSPLPAALAYELSQLDPDCAMAGLLDAIEDRLLRLLVAAQVRRAVDHPQAHREELQRLAGPVPAAEAGIVGRLCDGPTADAVAARLALAAGCAVRVEAVADGDLGLGPGRSQVLGAAALGTDLALGERVHAPELGCHIELGPVEPAAAGALRPGGSRHVALLDAIARGMPPCLAWRIDLLVRPRQGHGALGLDLRLDGDPPAVEREILARSGL